LFWTQAASSLVHCSGAFPWTAKSGSQPQTAGGQLACLWHAEQNGAYVMPMNKLAALLTRQVQRCGRQI